MIKNAEQKDIHVIEDILIDAVNWMNSNNIPNMWTEENVKWDILSKSYDISNFYIYYINRQPAGCMALTNEDKKYWKSDRQGESLYLHKLAVKQNYRGMSISSELINYAKQMAISSGIKSIKLDCNADRLKLMKLYENNGFDFVNTFYMNDSYKMARYIWDATSNLVK